MPPDPQQTEWIALAGILVPWIAIGSGIYAIVYFAFKYASEGRDIRINEMIEKRIHPIEAKLDTLIGDIAILKDRK